jgi:hypothetical protein
MSASDPPRHTRFNLLFCVAAILRIASISLVEFLLFFHLVAIQFLDLLVEKDMCFFATPRVGSRTSD